VPAQATGCRIDFPHSNGLLMGSDQISLRAPNRTGPNALRPSITVPFLSCPVLSPPLPRSAPSAPPNHGGNGRAPPQRSRARGQAPLPLLVTAAATVWLPRNPGLSLPAPAAARGLGRERDERGQDGRGDHREVRPRVRPLEGKQARSILRKRAVNLARQAAHVS
jgi:hypothetical protein